METSCALLFKRNKTPLIFSPLTDREGFAHPGVSPLCFMPLFAEPGPDKPQRKRHLPAPCWGWGGGHFPPHSRGCGPVACVQWPDYGLAGCGPGRAWPSSQMNGCNYTTEVITLALFPLSVALPASPRKGGFGFVLQCNFFVGTGFFGNSQTGYLCYGHSFPGTQSGNYTARGRLQMGLFFSGHAFCEVDEKSSVF